MPLSHGMKQQEGCFGISFLEDCGRTLSCKLYVCSSLQAHVASGISPKGLAKAIKLPSEQAFTEHSDTIWGVWHSGLSF